MTWGKIVLISQTDTEHDNEYKVKQQEYSYRAIPHSLAFKRRTISTNDGGEVGYASALKCEFILKCHQEQYTYAVRLMVS